MLTETYRYQWSVYVRVPDAASGFIVNCWRDRSEAALAFVRACYPRATLVVPA